MTSSCHEAGMPSSASVHGTTWALLSTQDTKTLHPIIETLYPCFCPRNELFHLIQTCTLQDSEFAGHAHVYSMQHLQILSYLEKDMSVWVQLWAYLRFMMKVKQRMTQKEQAACRENSYPDTYSSMNNNDKDVKVLTAFQVRPFWRKWG